MPPNQSTEINTRSEKDPRLHPGDTRSSDTRTLNRHNPGSDGMVEKFKSIILLLQLVKSPDTGLGRLSRTSLLILIKILMILPYFLID
jgi:hypothetical protein